MAMNMISSEVIQEIKEKLPCREREVDELAFKMASGWPLITVYGQRGCGKSTLVQSIVSKTCHPFCLIDLATGTSPRDVFTAILCDLKKSKCPTLSPLQLYLESECNEATDFVNKVQDSFSSKDTSSSRMFVVIDSAEILLDMDASFINILCKLPEVLKQSLKLQIILISSLPPFAFLKPGILLTPPLEVHLESYTRDQMISILNHRQRKDHKKDLYDNYVHIIVGALYDITRSLADMAYTADENFDLYMDPVTRGEVKEHDSTKLWRHFEPHVKKLASSVGRGGFVEEVLPEDLPYATRYLLIACYLVSFNSKTSDKRFFVKNQVGRHISRAVNKKYGEGQGPKAFTLERLLQVYRSLICLNFDFEGEDESSSIVASSRLMMPSTEIMTHLEDLLNLKLVLRVGTPSLSSLKKWKLSDSVTTDYIKGVASTVNFDLLSHLEQHVFKK